jgi:hypothetical protein
MPFVLDASSALQCPHGGAVKHVPSQIRVSIQGVPVLTQSDLGTVVGCAFTIPGPKPSPCVTTQWLQAALRVSVNGVPVLLQSSQGLCKSPELAPQGPPIPGVVQPRVQGM